MSNPAITETISLIVEAVLGSKQLGLREEMEKTRGMRLLSARQVKEIYNLTEYECGQLSTKIVHFESGANAHPRFRVMDVEKYIKDKLKNPRK